MQMKRLDYNEIVEQLKGLWRDFLLQYGIEVPEISDGLNTKNHPCPLCGGDDRAHWREQDGRLALYCRNCAFDKMKSPEDVIMEKMGIPFSELVMDAGNFVNHVPIERMVEAQKRANLPKINLPPEHKTDPYNAERMLAKCDVAEVANMTLHYCNGYFYAAITNANMDVINCARICSESQLDQMFDPVFITGSISYGGFTFINDKPKDEVLLVRDFSIAHALSFIYGGSIAVAYNEANMYYLCLKGLKGEFNMKPVIDLCADDYLCYEMDHYKYDLESTLVKCERDTTYD